MYPIQMVMDHIVEHDTTDVILFHNLKIGFIVKLWFKIGSHESKCAARVIVASLDMICEFERVSLHTMIPEIII